MQKLKTYSTKMKPSQIKELLTEIVILKSIITLFLIMAIALSAMYISIIKKEHYSFQAKVNVVKMKTLDIKKATLKLERIISNHN